MAAPAPVSQTSPTEFQRPGIAAPDPDASKVPPVSVQGQTFRLWATGNRAGASIALRLFLLDSQSRVISACPVQFTAGMTPDWGASYSGLSAVDTWWLASGARMLVIKCDSLTAGSSWDVCGAWCAD